MGSDGSCNIAQGNVKGEEIPMKTITPGLYRCQNSCFCFSIVKWATGIGFNLLALPSLGSEMALSTLSSTQDANWNVPWTAAPQLYICAWDMHPGRLGIPPLHHFSTETALQERQFRKNGRTKRDEALRAVFLECDFFRAGDIPLSDGGKGQSRLATSWQWK